ncbi:hypothetical protein [Saccharolobus caldissimus]|uniref:Thioredoxin domain-containing protein n=1 Tax=Saccharolobus caldissimus TaxID=1702097 RepID=A0AAQ4CN33_9CREN|nr:hypothetical protein [Saccharolobus caldissimus]BDB97214.1 hypothetical protein SACC_02310 [Saccharolobus caldissimus]
MLINNRVIDDAKFYDKPILLFFTDDNCIDCDKLYQQLDKLYITSKYLTLKVHALEYIQYTVRLSRGVIPTISILDPYLNLLGVIESKDLKFIESKLRELFDNYKNKKIKGIKLEEFVPEPIDPIPSIIYETVNRVIEGFEADSRMIEVYLTYSNVYKDYLKAKDKIKYADKLARYLLERNTKVEMDKTYSANVAMLVNYGLESSEDLLDFINVNTGEVYRSKRKMNRGILLDQALVGNALLSVYERTFNEEYLGLSFKIANYIKDNLQHEKGFRDSKIEDEITKIAYLEPISNSETSIFFARLWNITNDENYRNFALKALSSALGATLDNPKVIARASIAYLKIFESVRANSQIDYIDSRITVVKDNGCGKGMLYYDGRCYSKIDDILPKSF